MDYLQLLPNDILKQTYLYLYIDDLFKYRYDLDKHFFRQKLKIDFPDKSIVDEENIKINYWTNYYLQLLREIEQLESENNQLIFKSINEYPNFQIKIYNSIEQNREKINKLRQKEWQIKKYIQDKRWPKYKNWPTIKENVGEMKELDIIYLGGGSYNIKIDSELFPLETVEISKYPVKLTGQFKEILSYVYLQNFII